MTPSERSDDNELVRDYNRLHSAAGRLIRALEQEESEYGFPFNFEARDALRALRAEMERDS